MTNITNKVKRCGGKSFTLHTSLFTPLAAVLLMTSCGVYEKYQSATTVPDNVYGTTETVRQAQQTACIGEMSWREYFTDPKLQQLIDTALVRNVDIATARIRLDQANVVLTSAKLAYFPSVYLTPQAGITRFNDATVKTYNIGANVQWNIYPFGVLANAKRLADAQKRQAEVAAQAVRSQVVASVAQAYSQLQMLDEQLRIVEATEKLWYKSLDTQRALMQNGKAYSTAVNQMEASYLGVKAQILDIKDNINNVENVICLLLDMTPQTISRSVWTSNQLPQRIGTGVPALMLSNRPDVRMAELNLEATHYSVQAARSAFYPSLTLGGTLGWTNGDGGSINPGKLLLNAAASLTQPLFAQGKLRAQLKNARLEQEEAINRMAHTILAAGKDVNDALRACQLANEKDPIIKSQVAALNAAYDGTHVLMDNGKASYIEVLMAQEALLNAQLAEAANLYNGKQALIALYLSLGGGIQ